MQVKPGDVLEGDFWPESVRVLTVQSSGPRVRIEAVGLRTQQFFPRILSLDDLNKIRVSAQTGRDFSGRAEAFFLAVEAHRVRFAYQFDPLYAVNVSQVDPLPHQIEAVYHYILRNPRLRFLLADDPGAGKTIMTGLLLKELKYRGLVQRALVVVPGHLKDQWLREMKERFSETFTAVDRGVMNATWGRNVWQEQPLVITSMDFAKQDDVSGTLPISPRTYRRPFRALEFFSHFPAHTWRTSTPRGSSRRHVQGANPDAPNSARAFELGCPGDTARVHQAYR
jgi:hypothetical protein